MAAAPSGPGAEGRARLGALEWCSPLDGTPCDVPAANLLVATDEPDGPGAAAASPGKAVWGARTEGAETREREEAALIKLWPRSGLHGIA